MSQKYDRRVVVLRGLPGSGKSHLANTLHDYWTDLGRKVLVVSADHYFVDHLGAYHFRPEGLPDAHKECKRRFLKAVMGDKHDIVIVDNTHTTCAEMAYYVELADTLNIRTSIYKKVASVDVMLARQQHSVPHRSFMAMVKRWEDSLDRWPLEQSLDDEDVEFIAQKG